MNLVNGTTSEWTFVDNEGVVRKTEAGEVVYSGGRKVKNLFANTQELDLWFNYQNSVAISDSTIAPDGTMTADTLIDSNSGGSGYVVRSQNVNDVPGCTHVSP